MLKDYTEVSHVYIACGYTDLRRGIDGLVGIIQQRFKLDPFGDSIFMFCGRKPNRVKAIYWDKNGFVMLYKRLEEGKFQWPRSQDEVRSLSIQQLRWLMEGLSIDQPKAHKIISRVDLV